MGHVGKQAAYLITFGGVAGGVRWTWRVGNRVWALVSYPAICKQQGWGGESWGDNGWLFCTSVHSQKRKNHVYWDLILNKKIMSIKTRNFARITKKKNLMKGWTKLLASKGHRVLTLLPLSEKAKCCSSFLSAACSLPGNLPEEASTSLQGKGLTGFVWSPNPPVLHRCVSWPRPPRPNQSQHVLSLYCTQRGMHVKGNTYTV